MEAMPVGRDVTLEGAQVSLAGEYVDADLYCPTPEGQ